MDNEFTGDTRGAKEITRACPICKGGPSNLRAVREGGVSAVHCDRCHWSFVFGMWGLYYPDTTTMAFNDTANTALNPHLVGTPHDTEAR